jgi:hypothetical protein
VSHNISVVAFFVPPFQNPDPENQAPEAAASGFGLKVAKDRKRPFAIKSTFVIRKYPTHPTLLLYQKKWDCQGFYFIFFALFGLTYGTKWDTLTRPNKNERIKNEIL